MSNISKIIIGIVAVLLIGFGIWTLTKKTPDTATTTNTANDTTAYIPPNNQTQQGASTTTTTTVVTTTNSNDAALTQDMAAMDAQMSGLASDNAAADKGLNNSTETH